jgi:hypothetical protein
MAKGLGGRKARASIASRRLFMVNSMALPNSYELELEFVDGDVVTPNIRAVATNVVEQSFTIEAPLTMQQAKLVIESCNQGGEPSNVELQVTQLREHHGIKLECVFTRQELVGLGFSPDAFDLPTA